MVPPLTEKLMTKKTINGEVDAQGYSAYSGYAHLGAGLTVGMSSLAEGFSESTA